MDWARIKTILIAVLLLTNAVLGFVIFRESNNFQRANEAKISNIIELYEAKGVKISQKNWKFPRKIKSIEVEYDVYDTDKIKDIIGDDFEYDNEAYHSQNGSVLLSGTIIEFYKKEHRPDFDLFEQSHIINSGIPIPEGTANAFHKNVCEGYLKKLGFNQNHAYKHILRKGDYVFVVLQQTYGDHFLDDSTMVLIIYEDEVVGFKRKWLKIIESKYVQKYDIISVDRALYILMNAFAKGDVIEKITLGYKLNDSSLLVTNLVSGEALPYYKVTLESGKEYYVQAVWEEES